MPKQKFPPLVLLKFFPNFPLKFFSRNFPKKSLQRASPNFKQMLSGIEMEEEVSDSSDSESDDSDDEAARQQLREMEERIGVIPERRDDKLSKRKVKISLESKNLIKRIDLISVKIKPETKIK